MRIHGAGFITAGTQNIYFQIPLFKPFSATNVEISDASFVFRQNNSYLYGTTADIWVVYPVRAVFGSDYLLAVVTVDSDSNAINNNPVGIQCNCTIKFS